MTRPPHYLRSVAVLIVAVLMTGCASADEAVDPVGATPMTTPTESTTPSALSEQWACSPDQVYGFFTDPVVYPADLSLAEVASKLDGETFDVDSNTGRLASVTFRNGRGLIVRRLEFERSESVGWHIERGRAC